MDASVVISLPFKQVDRRLTQGLERWLSSESPSIPTLTVAYARARAVAYNTVTRR